ncbi:DUF4124 domain-containing protein [Agaribacterium haliotis]|uniref:DUF4124 domain-containing protein n=1 Tax=Agaribacterium haliotis TaxID=2013869 RepID=UPI0013041503|nr:DUF4124 domain-containing protein [Agaribacterium haliotis]
MSLFKSALIYHLVLVTAATGTTSAGIYKWTDANGKVHFSDKKHGHIQQEQITLDTQQSAWNRYNIEVKTIGATLSANEQRQIAEGVNWVYEFYDRVLFFDFYKTVPVSITVLSDKSAYISHLQKTYHYDARHSLGVYLRSHNRIYTYINEQDRSRTFRTIKHETSHAIVDTLSTYTPRWLNEGLAEQMEFISKNNGRLNIQAHKINQRIVQQDVKTGKILSVEQLLKMKSSDWGRHMANNSSLQSQAGQFVNLLMQTGPDRSFISRLLHNFVRGDRTLSYYLVDDNYVGGIKTLELKWRRWAKTPGDKSITL